MKDLNQLLQLPKGCLVNRKITKAFFKRNFDLTLSERKFLDDTSLIQEIEWTASIKPSNSNIPSVDDGVGIFEEVQVISVTLGSTDFNKSVPTSIALIQKYIPYHILLAVSNHKQLIFNTALKRVNLNDSDKRSIIMELTSDIIFLNNPSQEQNLFLENCAFEKLDKQDLRTLYLSWSTCITSLKASLHTGEYLSRPVEQAESDVKLLEEIRKIETEILQLQNRAKKETQLNVQIQINAEVQTLRNKLSELKEALQKSTL